MTRKACRTGWRIAAAVIFIALAARFVWVASTTETGWGLVRVMWPDAALGAFGAAHESIVISTPERQAEFWEATTERILAEHPDSADLAMGAAWTLSAPATEWMPWPSRAGWLLPRRPEQTPDERQTHSALEHRFDRLAQKRCLDLAELATQLKPNDVDYWRARTVFMAEALDDEYYLKASEALESWKNDASRLRSSSRWSSLGGLWPLQPTLQEVLPPVVSEEWLAYLDLAASHDPDNALYDYLAALHLWRASGNYNLPNDNEYFAHITDRATFDRAMERFDRAQSLPLLAFGERSRAAAALVLAMAHIPPHEQVESGFDRQTLHQAATFVRDIVRWLDAIANESTCRGDVKHAWDVYRQSLRIREQLWAAHETMVLHGAFVLSDNPTVYRLRELSHHYPKYLPADSQAFVDAAAARLDDRKAASLAAFTQNGWSVFEPIVERRDTLLGLASYSAAELLALTAEIALIAYVVALLLRAPATHRDDRLRTWQHIVCWTVAVTLTFVVAGLGGVELIKPSTAGMIGAAAAAVPLVWMIWMICLAVYRRATRRLRLRTLFLLLTVFGVCFAVASTTGVAHVRLASLARPFTPTLRGSAVVSAGALYVQYYNSWAWPVVQWHLHYGQPLSAVVAFGLIAVWAAHRAKIDKESDAPKRWRARTAAGLAAIRRSATVVACLMLLAYLAVTPEFLRGADRIYASRLEHMRDPDRHWDKLSRAYSESLANLQAARAATNSGAAAARFP